VSRLVLVLGGARSGKSAHAESLVSAGGLERVYIATAESGDPEMAARIAAHLARRGSDWRTVEAPYDLEDAIAAEAEEGRAVLVDCLTLWLSNLMAADADVEARTGRLVETAKAAAGLRVFVSNEVGLGIVPDTAIGRRFRDAQGRMNQAIAAAADHVVFTAAGLPLTLKGTA
jgi:adenosylcobinamide kinase/adenosylcobinamide-phosphate guanylyltransferase